MSAISTSISGVLDRLLDQLQRRREHAMAEAPTASRSLRIAELYEQEARAWSLLFERSRSRIHWRAALNAEAYAKACARGWRSRAASEAAHEPAPDEFAVLSYGAAGGAA